MRAVLLEVMMLGNVQEGLPFQDWEDQGRLPRANNISVIEVTTLSYV